MKALIGEENGDWELRSARQNGDDESYSVGRGDYFATPEKNIRTLKVKTMFGYKRYKFFMTFKENPVPFNLADRTGLDPIDTSETLRSFRRAHIVQALGRAAREQPGNNDQKMKLILYAGAGIIGLILYYTGVFESLFGWLTGA